MLRESAAIPLARAVETVPAPLAENFAHACAQCATAAFLTRSRNRARNTRCGNLPGARHCAHTHPLLQSDLVGALSLLQRTSATLPASCRSGRPKSSLSDCSRNVETV